MECGGWGDGGAAVGSGAGQGHVRAARGDIDAFRPRFRCGDKVSAMQFHLSNVSQSRVPIHLPSIPGVLPSLMSMGQRISHDTPRADWMKPWFSFVHDHHGGELGVCVLASG